MKRREFLRKTGQNLVGASLGWVMASWWQKDYVQAEQQEKAPPHDRFTVGFIGVGGMGSGHLDWFLGQGDCEVAAICDVHAGRRAAAIAKTGGKAEGYNDYRELLDRKDIDLVVISTPDHWHALPTIHACQAGKDVYVEKPLSLTIEEGCAMVNAARRYNRIVQVGTQQRAADHFRRAVEIVRSGKIGKVKLARAWMGGGFGGGGWPADEEPPPELDWDMWLGPAPKVPYNPARFSGFRAFWDYSGGLLTDWGTHLIDIIHWGTGEDTPVSIEARGRYVDGINQVPNDLEVIYEYPTHTLIYSQPPPSPLPLGQPGHGMYFEGTKGRLFVDRGGFQVDPPELDIEIRPSDFQLPRVPGQQREFLDCVKTRQRPTCDVEVGHRSTSAPHLGNIAFKMGRKLRWDGRAERFIDDEAANRLISKPYRKPWHL